MRKINKEKLAREIIDWAKRNELGYDWAIYYNGKRYRAWKQDFEEVNHLDYCEYFSKEMIMGMSYDGTMYEIMNWYWGEGILDELNAILEKHGLYMELCDYCHCEFCEA